MEARFCDTMVSGSLPIAFHPSVIGRMRIGAVAFALAAAFSTPAVTRAQDITIPAPTGMVNDFAGVIDEATRQRLNRIAEDVRARSGGEMAIVTLPDIGQRAASDIALRIGREWKVGRIASPGDATRNAGAVVLLVPKETSSDGRGHCFIATGQGAEGFITDGAAGEICREATPHSGRATTRRGSSWSRFAPLSVLRRSSTSASTPVSFLRR